MKQITFFLSFIFLSISLLGQGTLQFNRVFVLAKNTVYTVPTDKVWKITGATYSVRGFYYGNSNEEPTFELNGISQYLNTFSHYFASGYVGDAFTTAFPMWLPAATTIRPKGAVETMYGIEFNIVP